VVGEHEHRRVEGRVLAPPAPPGGILGPGAGAAPEHVAAYHDGTDVRLGLLDHGGAGVDLAAFLSLLPAPHLEGEEPLVQTYAADAQWVLLTMARQLMLVPANPCSSRMLLSGNL
jgi:hypothetical protein